MADDRAKEEVRARGEIRAILARTPYDLDIQANEKDYDNLLQDLSSVLGWQPKALLADLACVRCLYARSPRHNNDKHRRAVIAQAHRMILDDAHRLTVAAEAIEGASRELLELNLRYRAGLKQLLGEDWPERLVQWRDALRRASRWERDIRRRGRPQGAARFLAEHICQVLLRHDRRPTSGETGAFAKVVAIMINSLNFKEADVHGIVKAVVKSLRQSRLSTFG